MLNEEVKRMQTLAGLLKEEEEEKDYFEYLEETPQEVQDIIEKYADEIDLGYEKSQQLVDELETVGWTCDYGLDGIPINLQPKGGMSEGMSDEEFAAAQEEEALGLHPEKDKIKAIQDMMGAEKPKKEQAGDDILTYNDVKPGDDVYVKSVDRFGEIASLGDVDEDQPETAFVRFGYFDKNPQEFALSDLEIMEEEGEFEEDEYDPDMARDVKYDR